VPGLQVNVEVCRRLSGLDLGQSPVAVLSIFLAEVYLDSSIRRHGW
jgi:hypothetical protein